MRLFLPTTIKSDDIRHFLRRRRPSHAHSQGSSPADALLLGYLAPVVLFNIGELFPAIFTLFCVLRFSFGSSIYTFNKAPLIIIPCLIIASAPIRQESLIPFTMINDCLSFLSPKFSSKIPDQQTDIGPRSFGIGVR